MTHKNLPVCSETAKAPIANRPAGVALGVSADLLNVLWRPISTLQKKRSAGDVALLLMTMLAIDFVLALMLIPTFLAEIQNAADTTLISANAKVSALGVAVIMSSTVNGMILALMAALFFAVLLICMEKPDYRDLLGALLLASAPLVVDRIVRFLAALLIAGRSPTETLMPLSYFISASPDSQWSKLLNYFGLFDVWAFILVGLGISITSDSRVRSALFAVVLLWGGLQAFMARLYLSGVLGA